MYQAYNNYIIATQANEQVTSASGIITTANNAPRYKVERTNDTTKELSGKMVIARKVDQLDSTYFAIDYNDVVAIVE